MKSCGCDPTRICSFKVSDVIGKKPAPNFGPFAGAKAEAVLRQKAGADLLGANRAGSERPANAPAAKIPSVQEVIGTALDKIGTYNDLDNK